MNQTIKDFLERNGINPEKVPEKININLTNPERFNRFLCYFDVQKDKEKRQVCITDIIGSDAFNYDGNIYNLMERFFDEQGDPYHRRSTDLLEIPSSDIMESLKYSFSDDEIILADYDGKYFVRTNGNHRIFAMYMNYLLESQNADTPEKQEALKKKYTFPALVGEIDTDKSYANFMLQSKRSKKYIDRVFDREQFRTTDDFEIVSNGVRKKVEDEAEIDEFVRENFIESVKRGDTYLIDGLTVAAKSHKSFRKFFSKTFPEIEEKDVAIVLEKMSKEIFLGKPDFSGVKSFGDILDIVNSNTNSLKKVKKQFAKFSEVVSKSDKQMDEYFSIMDINQDGRDNIEALTDRCNSIIEQAEDMLNESYRIYSKELYQRAKGAIQALSELDYSKLAKAYYTNGFSELEEKISQIAVKLQSDGQIKEINDKKKEEEEKKFSIIDRIRGKSKLRDATVRNLELQKQYIKKTMHNPKPMSESVRNLFNYMKVHGASPEMSEFMTRLGNLDKASDFLHLDKICIEAFLPVKRNVKKLSPRKQAKALDEENNGMEEKIASEKGQKLTDKVKVDDMSRRKGILKRVSKDISQAEAALFPEAQERETDKILVSAMEK